MFIKRAVSVQELNDVYRVRYDVYCLERGFEEPSSCPGRRESDGYDPYSLHFIAYASLPEGGMLPVGTVRLILPNPQGLPVEKHCNVDVSKFCADPERVAEISRLAVSSVAARRAGISKRLITLGLITALSNGLRSLKTDYVVVAMSRGLERLLKACGLGFLAAGLPVEYHGIRTPFYAEVGALRAGLVFALAGAGVAVEDFFTPPVNYSDEAGLHPRSLHPIAA